MSPVDDLIQREASRDDRGQPSLRGKRQRLQDERFNLLMTDKTRICSRGHRRDRQQRSRVQMEVAGGEPAFQELARRGADHATKRTCEVCGI
jgi:hypothetical protein